jgi:hypothetical protein
MARGKKMPFSELISTDEPAWEETAWMLTTSGASIKKNKYLHPLHQKMEPKWVVQYPEKRNNDISERLDAPW